MFVVCRLPFGAGACAPMEMRSATDDSSPLAQCAPQRGFHALNQSPEHLLHIVRRPVKSLCVFGNQESQIPGQHQKVNQFVCGSRGDMEKLPKLRIRASSTPLRNIGWNRSSGPPYLADQPKPLGIWVSCRGAIDTQSQQMALLPDLKLLEVLHRGASRTKRETYYSLLYLYIDN